MRALSRTLQMTLTLAGAAWLAGCATVSLDNPGWPPVDGRRSAPVETRSTVPSRIPAPVPPPPSVQDQLEDAGVVVTPVQDASLPRVPVASEPEAPAQDLSWVGHYDGMLPCGDCEGIRTLLSLYENHTYILSMKREGSNSLPSIMRGSFSWNADHTVVQLDQNAQNRRYQVLGGSARLLNKDGSLITGVLADRYILKQRQD